MLPDDRYRALDQRVRAALAGDDAALDDLAPHDVDAWRAERNRREQEREAVRRELRDQAAARAEAERLAALRGRSRIIESLSRERR